MRLLEEWYRHETRDYDEEFVHREPNEEMMFYRYVASGNIEAVRENCKAHRFMDSSGVGVLSRDPIQNMKYHFVVGTALIARTCAEEGMGTEMAFRLSDFYIQKLDYITTLKDIENLHVKMVMDYTRRMKVAHQNAGFSRPINSCMNYIYAHIKERITIEDLAEHTHNSASYISRLFKEELGISASDYIRKAKIETSKNLLRYSEYSLIDIANYLSFSSQSHFIQVFQKEVGMTPKKYRELYFSTFWKSGSDEAESKEEQTAGDSVPSQD